MSLSAKTSPDRNLCSVKDAQQCELKIEVPSGLTGLKAFGSKSAINPRLLSQ